MREASWAGGCHPAENVCRGVGVADGDVDAQFARSGKALQCAVDLGGHCEEQGIVTGECTKFSDSFLCGLEHLVCGMRAAVAGLGGEERSLNVPACDRPAKLGVGITELLRPGQASGHRLPVIGDEGEKNFLAARMA